MFTIVTITKLPDGKRHVHEIETNLKSTFDMIVDFVFSSRLKEAAYLVDEDGKMVDSYIKEDN